MIRAIAIFLFTIGGWKLKGEMPAHIKKSILVAGPHTSNFDIFFALAGLHKMKIPVRFMLKKEWLKYFPIKNVLLSAGAFGIDRSKKSTMVESVADSINQSKENLAILIAPEGTRKHACIWKTGFYYIALKAKVPIVLTHLDYSKKEAAIGPNFMPTGDYKQDMQIVKDYYKNISAKYPENFCLKIYEEDQAEACAK